VATGETQHNSSFLFAQIETITEATRPYAEEITATTSEWGEITSLDGIVHASYLTDIKEALDNQQTEALTAIQTISGPIPDELFEELLKYDNDITHQIDGIDGEITGLEDELQVKLDEIQAEADKVLEKAPRFAETINATRQQLVSQALAQHLAQISHITQKRHQLETVRADIDALYTNAGSTPLPMEYTNRRAESNQVRGGQEAEDETTLQVDSIFDGVEIGTEPKNWAAHRPEGSEPPKDISLGEYRKAVNSALSRRI